MGIADLIAAGLELANRILQRTWGDRTSRQDQLRAAAERAGQKKREAMGLYKEAQRRKDKHAMAQYLSAANGWDSELKRLSDQAAADVD